jgi:hypothetical protein
MNAETRSAQLVEYEAPTLTTLGSLHDLTLCDKVYGDSDGNTFMGTPIVCRST